MVHGMAAGRGEALRAMPAIASLGYPILVISYRNDPDAPRNKDRLYHLGASEWEDLQAAVRYALKRGARRVVLYGFSMGGTIAADMLDRSMHSHDVAAVVLDAPVLDWDAAVQLAAQRRRVPGVLTAVAEWWVGVRTGFQWGGHEGKVVASEFTMPVLLFHGTADATVPIGPSESLAAAAGERVTLVRTPGAGHVQSWNFDPEGYDRALRTWLPRVAPDSL
jgi:alpha-beta hydrolase superfamily lysophospholipase